MVNKVQQDKSLKSLKALMSQRVTDLEILWLERVKQNRKVNGYINDYTYLYTYHLSFFMETYEELQGAVCKLLKHAGVQMEQSLHLRIKQAFDHQKQFMQWF